jgi:diguanylate cyclase (GGDEF)-like protein/PAS domain S-box-containing protein
VTTFVDVTDRLASQAALRRSEEQFRLAMAHAPVGMALVSLDGHFLEVNEALARMTGYGVDELVGRTFQQITHPDDIDSDLEQLGLLVSGSITHYTIEKRYLRADGEQVWILLAVSMVRDEDGSPAYFISQIQDVTAARATQERLVHRALHDPLTGLANRELILDHLERAAARAQRQGDEVAVLFVDLDHFKDVNDTYGHEVGDTLLMAVADRLRSAVRPADTVGRLGGDEFVVVVEDVPDDDLALALVNRIQHELARPVGIAGRTHHVAASIGVTQGVGRDARAMLREADEAMYRAKALGRGRYELFRRRAGSGPTEIKAVPAEVTDIRSRRA